MDGGTVDAVSFILLMVKNFISTPPSIMNNGKSALLLSWHHLLPRIAIE
jgi:hypothetical protein